MSKPAINFYTSDASLGEFRSFAELLGENLDQPICLRPLSELPAPDKQGKQRLRTQRVGLQELLSAVQHCITVGEGDPIRFQEALVDMRRDRDMYAFHIAAIDQQLAEAGEAVARYQATFIGTALAGGYQPGHTYTIWCGEGLFAPYALHSEELPGETIEYYDQAEIKQNWQWEGGEDNV